jgi:hypothetical protein
MTKPLVSVVLEAYNEEHNALAPPEDSLDALLRQRFELDQVELVLIGSSNQITHWRQLDLNWRAFGAVTMIPADSGGAHYWELKNKGAEVAQGEILAFIDCDALPGPHWLSSIVTGLQNGADVSVGPSLYRSRRLGPDSPWMLAAALPSWAFALARTTTGQNPEAGALMAHNLGMRRDLFRRHPFRPMKRSLCSSLLYFELVRSGAKFCYQPDQKVAHGMTFGWWLSRMHFRRGWETYCGRKADQSWPRIRLLERMKIIEPIVLRMALVCRDARHWFRFGRVIGISRTRTILVFPLAVLASCTARAAEAVGMYAALIAPETTAHQARF